MEFDLYFITQEGMKLDLTKPQLLPEEKWILTILKEQPYSIYGILTQIKEKNKEELTHYKTKQILTMLKAQGYVGVRE
jgi:hypothetical protein